MEKVNIAEKLSHFSDHFNPRIAGELNGQQVKLVKFKGEFVWHHHDKEDELFYVVKGSFDMHLREKIITVNEGEFLIMPKGIEHKPVAQEEVEIMLFEPATTINTGNIIDSELTRTDLSKI
ncbi:MAG TPA: cupin domain-containing protein [Chitinophagaceae bacterium]|nr:cupin domain-containing protein [Chitinophagaceae bacterium]